MDSDSDSLLDQDMISSASSSRASTPTHHEDFHVSCKRKREIERELKTYTDSIDHCQVLIRNLERQGLVNHPIYSNQCAMIQGLMKQRELLTELTFNLNFKIHVPFKCYLGFQKGHSCILVDLFLGIEETTQTKQVVLHVVFADSFVYLQRQVLLLAG
ncbi:hypothetical protein NPIL_368661 [Nephila pilipes]|uniref:Uncharacterized protein n=1 Tax=Nephila pilipes TaxID=299642 RepID=A0A8X6U675_NEPPI|nr:hypothetical protein NPIL_368661 [Nephila pilipes]